ncbi:MAG TPA: hypothetical protein VMH28_16575 [Candidatus Acidoferrales bacterium]|nr:hypothetical protein [Candidatus Acidoferrales bacterium]
MKVISSAVLFASLALGTLVYGQATDQNPQSQPQQQQPQNDAPKVSVTGCLAKSATTTYTITDQKTGDKFPFEGPQQLDRFVNQTVTLTGTMRTEGSTKVFKPETINSVSPTCETAK